MEDISNLNDHDLLIVLHSEVRGLRNDVKSLNDNTAKRIDDHETRVRSLEKKVWGAAAVASAAGATISFIASYFLK